MSVSNGQIANQTTFNNAFVSKTAATGNDATGIVGLNNTSDVNSGNQILNTQRLINEVANADGTVGEGDTTRKTYSSNVVVSNGDDRKVAIGKLDAAFNPASGRFVSTLNGLAGIVDISNAKGLTVDTSGIDVLVGIDAFEKTLYPQTTLTDNTSSATTITSVATSLNIGRIFYYSLIRGTNVRAGIIIAITDGTDVSLVETPSVEIGDCGVTFSAALETISMVQALSLQYTTTSTGTDAKIWIEQKNLAKPV